MRPRAGWSVGVVRVTSDSSRGLDVLAVDECIALLERCPVGRVGVDLAGEGPAVFPVNYAFDGRDVTFRTNTGSLLHRADQSRVAFEIDGIDRVYHQGWSVLVVGLLRAVTNTAECEALAELPVGAWVPGLRPQWMRIHPERITGRCIPPTGPANRSL
jgi:nitroimidazol reductase NimA-like FMN-containing flavoprotein (pyridoxamine 5'-phosphate oxidase superfamily)